MQWQCAGLDKQVKFSNDSGGFSSLRKPQVSETQRYEGFAVTGLKWLDFGLIKDSKLHYSVLFCSKFAVRLDNAEKRH